MSSPRSNRRRVTLLVALSLSALAACGNPAPPAKELAVEMIDTLNESENSENVKACMRQRVEEFTLTPEEATGFEDFDDVAAKADGGNVLAQQVIARFESQLAACRR